MGRELREAKGLEQERRGDEPEGVSESWNTCGLEAWRKRELSLRAVQNYQASAFPLL